MAMIADRAGRVRDERARGQREVPPAAATHWEYLLPIAVVHLLACLAFLPALASMSGMVLAFVGLTLFGTLGINLGYHRLLSHHALEVPKWLEHTFTTLALCSLEDTPLRWVTTHRLHHVHSDTPSDPHSPRDGVMWSHCGWLFRRAPDRRTVAAFDRYARDLLVDPWYRRLESRPFTILWIYLGQMLLFAVAGFAFGALLTGGAAAGARLAASWVVWGVLVRTVAVWHITWSVNSLTHLLGYRTYDTGEDSRNNWFVALVANGEGWHNNHHHDPASASNQHRWWELDVTWWIILALERAGLATAVIRPRHVRREARAPRPR